MFPPFLISELEPRHRFIFYPSYEQQSYQQQLHIYIASGADFHAPCVTCAVNALMLLAYETVTGHGVCFDSVFNHGHAINYYQTRTCKSFMNILEAYPFLLRKEMNIYHGGPVFHLKVFSESTNSSFVSFRIHGMFRLQIMG